MTVLSNPEPSSYDSLQPALPSCIELQNSADWRFTLVLSVNKTVNIFVHVGSQWGIPHEPFMLYGTNWAGNLLWCFRSSCWPSEMSFFTNVLKNNSDLRYISAVTRNVRNERRTLDNSTEKKCVLYMCCIMLPNEVLLFQVTWRLRVRCGLRAAHVLHWFMHLPSQSLKIKLQKYI